MTTTTRPTIEDGLKQRERGGTRRGPRRTTSLANAHHSSKLRQKRRTLASSELETWEGVGRE
jgi:hypothetical protein